MTEAVFELADGRPQGNCSGHGCLQRKAAAYTTAAVAMRGKCIPQPAGDFAARLIEEAGLKGTASVEQKSLTLHANFIVNTGQATAEDVLTLMDHIQKTIEDQYGINLVPEVLVVGER